MVDDEIHPKVGSGSRSPVTSLSCGVIAKPWISESGRRSVRNLPIWELSSVILIARIWLIPKISVTENFRFIDFHPATSVLKFWLYTLFEKWKFNQFFISSDSFAPEFQSCRTWQFCHQALTPTFRPLWSPPKEKGRSYCGCNFCNMQCIWRQLTDKVSLEVHEYESTVTKGSLDWVSGI